MNHRNVGGVHSKTRSHVRNHGSSRAARSQNASGFCRASSSQRWTTGLMRVTAAQYTLSHESTRVGHKLSRVKTSRHESITSLHESRRLVSTCGRLVLTRVWIADSCCNVAVPTSSIGPFRAFRISQSGDRMSGAIVDTTLDELTPGDVVIKAEYSSVNYKDALAATGAAKILKKFPLIGGIDVCGTVASSTDKRFKAGDEV